MEGKETSLSQGRKAKERGSLIRLGFLGERRNKGFGAKATFCRRSTGRQGKKVPPQVLAENALETGSQKNRQKGSNLNLLNWIRSLGRNRGNVVGNQKGVKRKKWGVTVCKNAWQNYQP